MILTITLGFDASRSCLIEHPRGNSTSKNSPCAPVVAETLSQILRALKKTGLCAPAPEDTAGPIFMVIRRFARQAQAPANEFR